MEADVSATSNGVTDDVEEMMEDVSSFLRQNGPQIGMLRRECSDPRYRSRNW